jgi:hypothetical protein
MVLVFGISKQEYVPIQDAYLLSDLNNVKSSLEDDTLFHFSKQNKK